MILEVALDADPEWDSSSDWPRLAQAAAEAAIVHQAGMLLWLALVVISLVLFLTVERRQWRGLLTVCVLGQNSKRWLLACRIVALTSSTLWAAVVSLLRLWASTGI